MSFIFTSYIVLMPAVLSMVFASGTSTGAKTEPKTFSYFAYGSNLLKERLQLRNPSATMQSVAKLQDYKLVFGNHNGVVSKRWRGGVASIEPSKGDTVWGVVWRINTAHLTSLDRQEGVKSGVYSPVYVEVLSQGQTLTCRSYIMSNRVEAPPSPQYLKHQYQTTLNSLIRTGWGISWALGDDVIAMGAEQNDLPKSYQDQLKSIETNNYDGPLPVMDEVYTAIKNSKKESA